MRKTYNVIQGVAKFIREIQNSDSRDQKLKLNSVALQSMENPRRQCPSLLTTGHRIAMQNMSWLGG